MKQPIQFGLIGVGGIGAYHLSAIERLEKQGLARLVAVADPTEHRLAEQKAELAGKGVPWFVDYQEMLSEQRGLQAVAIGTPIPYHYEMARACIERGLFANLEKPPAPLLSQLDALIATDTDERIRVGFQLLGSRGMQELKRLIVDGRLGELREIRAGACWPRSDSYYQRASWAGRLVLGNRAVFDGPATNALAHLINGITFLAASEMQEFSEPSTIEAELYRARPIETYDTVCLRGTFSSGVEFSMAATHATQETLPFQIEVRGTRGWARLSEDGAVLESSGGVSFRESEDTQSLINGCYEKLIRLINGEQTVIPPSLRNTRGYVAATNAMYRSAGGISNIDPDVVERYGPQNNGGYHVPGLAAAIEENIATGELFSEQGLSWAQGQAKRISLEGLESLTLEDLHSGSPSGIELDVLPR